MYKKVWCTCEVVVLLIKPIVFWPSRCRPRRWILKSLIYRKRAACVWTEAQSDMIFVEAQKLSVIVWTPLRYVTLHFRDRRGAALLRHRNRAATTVFMCEQKPNPIWFSWRRKSCPIVWTPLRYFTLHFRDRRGAASVRYRNRAARAVFMCEQKLNPRWFSWRRKSFSV